MANWLELLPDVLGVITSYLTLRDVIRFSAVCKQWRFLAKQKRHAPVPQRPWLVLADDPATGKRTLYNMSEKRHYYFDIPELRGGYCVGSSFGWLFVVSSTLEGYLVNPFNGAHYRFPSLPLYTEDLKLGHVADGKITYEKDGQLNTWTMEDLQKMTVEKAILSDDPHKCKDFITVIIFEGKSTIAFCRPKDNEWTVIHDGYYVDDVIWFKGNIYAVGGANSLYAVHLGPEPKMVRIEPDVSEVLTNRDFWYLVDFFGKHLLLVHREVLDGDYDDDDSVGEHDDLEEHVMEDGGLVGEHIANPLEEDHIMEDGGLVGEHVALEEDHIMEDEDFAPDGDIAEEQHSMTISFAVFELDLENKRWHQWKDLGGNALFVGMNRAITVRAPEIPDCKADCIYYTSGPYEDDLTRYNEYGCEDVGTYNLIDGRLMEGFYDVNDIPITSLPTWLLPNP